MSMLTQRLNYRDMDDRSIAGILDSVSWPAFFQDRQDVHSMFTKFNTLCVELITTFTPTNRAIANRDRIAGCITRLEDTAAANPAQRASIAKKLLKTSRRKRILEESKLNFKDSKSFYRYANSRIKAHIPVPTLDNNGNPVVNDADRADLLASHFQSVFQNTDLEDSNRTGFFAPTVEHPDAPIIFPEELVYEHLNKLKPKLSSTPDSIPPIFYKKFALFLCEPLSIIYTHSYAQGVVPEQFKTSVVTPIHKRGKRSLPANFRPVAQGCVASVVFEKILAAHLMRHLQINRMLDEYEYALMYV